jgi:hypothetical protein
MTHYSCLEVNVISWVFCFYFIKKYIRKTLNIQIILARVSALVRVSSLFLVQQSFSSISLFRNNALELARDLSNYVVQTPHPPMPKNGKDRKV